MGVFNRKEELADTPSEVLNWRLYWSVFVFGILGASRGLDEGLVGGMVGMKSFHNEFHMGAGTEDEQANRESNITSMVQLGSIAGALLAFVLCDKIGRVRSLQALCGLWLVGFIIVINSHGNVAQILAGRFIAGLGIGMTTVVGPTFLVEVAPKAIRGMLTNIFAGSVYLGVMVAYFSNWGAAINLPKTSRMQWVAPQTAHIGFAGLLLILSFTVKETPRWLTMKGRHEEALKNLCFLRQLPADHSFVQNELLDVREQLEREQEATMGTSRWGKFRELVTIPSNRYRFMLGIMSQLLGQWSGASAITIYAAQFFAALGKTGQSEKLFATCILGVVKLCSAYLCAFFLIDFFGRRHSLYTGIMLQTLAIMYVAIFLAVVPKELLASGDLSPSQTKAATGAIAAIYISGFGWVSFRHGGDEIFLLTFVRQWVGTPSNTLSMLRFTPSAFVLWDLH